MLKITYRLAPGRSVGARLLCRIRVGKLQCKTDFATGIILSDQKDWIRHPVYRSKTDKAVNRQLEELEREIQEVYYEMRKYRRHLSGDDVKKAYLDRSNVFTSLEKLSLMVVEKVKSTPLAAKRTVQKNMSYHNKLFTFFKPDQNIDNIDEGAANLFYFFLLNKEKNSHNHAARCVQYLKRCLDIAYKRGLLPLNKLAEHNIPLKYPDIPDHLQRAEVRKLVQAKFTNPAMERARDIFLLMTETAMDYNDLYEFNRGRDCYQEGEFELIRRKRTKNGCAYTVPISPLARKLFEKYDWKPVEVTLQYYNRIVKEMCYLAGIKNYQRVTTKLARKTAAMQWVNAGLSVEVVSRMMGHEKISTTMKYYARVKSERVMREWRKLAG